MPDLDLQAFNDEIWNDSNMAYYQMEGRVEASREIDELLNKYGDNYAELRKVLEKELEANHDLQSGSNEGDSVDFYEGKIYTYQNVLEKVIKKEKKQ